MTVPEYMPAEPALPLFPDRLVTYNVVQPSGPNSERANPASQTVSVPVDEIENIADERLRGALWEQFQANENQSRSAIFVFVKFDGSFSHAMSAPRGRTLGVTFTQDGIIPSESTSRYYQTEPEGNRTQSANFIARLLKKFR